MNMKHLHILLSCEVVVTKNIDNLLVMGGYNLQPPQLKNQVVLNIIINEKTHVSVVGCRLLRVLFALYQSVDPQLTHN